MLSLKNELPLWRKVSEELDQLRKNKKTGNPDKVCPFCGKESVYVETLKTINGSDISSMIAFFTCRSCDETGVI